MIPVIENTQQIAQLFPKDMPSIQALATQATSDMLAALEQIYVIAPTERTFANTLGQFDKASALFSMRSTIIAVLEMVSEDKAVRDTAHAASLTLNNFVVDNVTYSKQLYKAFKQVADTADLKKLTSEERYFLQETLEDSKRLGLDKSQEIQEQLKEHKKKLGAHELAFDRAIAEDNRTIEVPKEHLTGLSPDFLASLKRSSTGNYIVGVDYPTYQHIRENCSYGPTRQALWKEYVNRGYPTNQHELESIVSLRDHIAHLVGFASFAHLDIDDQMAKTPERVEQFLNDLRDRSSAKTAQELEVLKKHLPDGVSLNAQGQFKPWDLAYTYNQYKKHHLTIDELAISEYFPVDHTIQVLFELYQDFFGVRFEKVALPMLWTSELQGLGVYKNNRFIGYILLDLFPREGKYTHACEITLVPTVEQDKHFYPALILVIANFPKATAAKPALLKRTDVITFFHEFGHALHAILGTTELAANSGAHVKRDFVEMPSQMLEEWMWQPTILKQVSKHYKTGAQLSDELIEKIAKLKAFDSGEFIQGQILYSLLSLRLFGPGAQKDIFKLTQELASKIMKHVEFNADNHFYASFGHLVGYGSKYYGYLWSKVFALDLFAKIKDAHFSPSIGQKYIDTVIGKGGSADPMDLLRNFLGRDPNSNAFFKDLGL